MFRRLVKIGVGRVTDSDWDIEEYRRCPGHLRHIQRGNRVPGFLPRKQSPHQKQLVP